MALPRFASCRCSREGGGGCLGLFKMAASRNQPNPHVMVWLSPAPLDTPRSKSLQMQLGWILAILTDSCFNIPLLVEQSCLRAPDTSQTSSLLQRVCPKIHPNLRELGGNLFVFFVFWGLFDFIFLFVSTNLGDKAAVNNLCPSTVIYSPAPYITGRYLGRRPVKAISAFFRFLGSPSILGLWVLYVQSIPRPWLTPSLRGPVRLEKE